jgi:hypothetical protein
MRDENDPKRLSIQGNRALEEARRSEWGAQLASARRPELP